jgi:hypothetical protein
MSVVLTPEQPFRISCQNPNAACTICDGRLLPPFLEWHGMEADLFICTRCCRKYKNGLLADMVQVAAIADLHDFGYPTQTFTRRDIRDVRNDALVRGLALGAPKSSSR